MPFNLIIKIKLMFILGVDIGLYHMGLVGCEVFPDFTLKSVEFCELVDITDFNCKNRKNDKGCVLFHEKCIADYMSHFFQNYEGIFDKSEYVIIERQPPMGLVAIQELILFKYRSKCVMVSPNSMHAYNDIGHLGYDDRKEMTIKLTTHNLKKFEYFNKLSRKHDISDALLIVKYFLSKKNKEYIRIKELEEWRTRNQTFIKNINAYAYTP